MILIRTMNEMTTRLPSSIRIFQIFLPMGRVNAMAIMQMPVAMRNIRSRRLIL